MVKRFIRTPALLSLAAVGGIIALIDTFVMLLLAVLPQWSIALTPLQQQLVSTLGVSLGAACLIGVGPVGRMFARPDRNAVESGGESGPCHPEQFDIQSMQETEQLLLALKRALDASAEMIFVTDVQGNIQYANPALCRFTGWAEAELIGRSPTVLDSSAADASTLAEMQRRLRETHAWKGRLLNRRRGAQPVRIAGQTPGPDPKEYWADISITAIRDDRQKLLGYVQIQRDVSDKVKNEQALLVENADTAARLAISETLQQALPFKARIEKVLDILFDLKAFDLQRKGGVFVKDPEQDFLNMLVLHGKFSEEFIRREQRIAYGACLCGRAAVSQEMIVSDDCFCDPRHDHTFEGMQAHGHYIVPLVSAGQILGVLFLYTDPYPMRLESRLTMLQQVGDMLALALLHEQAQKSLEDARDAAELAAKVKSEFLANMSHEIRTPMNGVLGMLDIIKDTALNAEQRELVETASNSAESLLSIINDILDFSKLEAGKVELERIEFNLPILVEEICALLSARAHDKKLELNCLLPPELPERWYGDPNRIRQILTNLIGNAIKFTDFGEVFVNVSVQPQAGGAQKVCFDVRDTGIGMTAEQQTRLFQPFAQADSSTARRFGGTGLGLSISKRLVEAMQGEIGVESTQGHGTRFWFALPLQAGETQMSAAINDVSGKNALIVDDNATNRKILRYYLEHWGMVVTESDNAAAALQKLEAVAENGNTFDILLTDLNMPQMDGYALAEAVGQNPLLAFMPRLLLSSSGLGEESERARFGFFQVLLKPVRQAVLFDAVTSALRASRATLPAAAKTEQDRPDYGGKRLLVVEDNKVNQKVIFSMLDKFNCLPDLAENGQEALERLAEKDYDLVLMDCQMPVMDGYEAVRRLRAQDDNARNRYTPVVALTAHASNQEREKCLALGMDDFLSKPITRPVLSAMLVRWLGGNGLEKPVAQQQKPVTENNMAAVWNKNQALLQLGGDEELLQELVELFIQDYPERLAVLEQAFAAGDWPALANAAHAIKGTGGHFRAEEVMRLATELEYQAKQGEVAALEQLVGDIKRAVAGLVAAFEQEG